MSNFHEILKDTFYETLDIESDDPMVEEVKKLFESINSEREYKIFFLGCWLSECLSYKQIDKLRELIGFNKVKE